MEIFLIPLVGFLACFTLIEIPTYLLIGRLTMEQAFMTYGQNLVSKVMGGVVAAIANYAGAALVYVLVSSAVLPHSTTGYDTSFLSNLAFSVAHLFLSKRVISHRTSLTGMRLWVICAIITLVPWIPWHFLKHSSLYQAFMPHNV